MLTNCVSILETHFFDFFYKSEGHYIYDHATFLMFTFKKDTDLKKERIDCMSWTTMSIKY